VRIRASLAAVLAVAGFLTVVSSQGREDVRRGAESRRSGLVRLIKERQAEVEELGRTLVELRGEVLAARRRISERSASDARRVRQVQLRAGMTAMAGPGLEVVLADSDRETDDPAEQEALTIQDVDLQLVVNALWAAGAEAMAVNGQRLVATSPIRGAGETITVNFRPLAPPYRVRAIGADKEAFEEARVVKRFEGWAEDFDLGFDVRRRSKLEVPAYAGPLQLQVAQVAPAVPDQGESR
jgi:uncharacterized protein YlxW (UPF0749 family)